MPSPTTLTAKPSNRPGSVFTVTDAETALQRRIYNQIPALKKRFPSRISTIDIWHREQIRTAANVPQTIWVRVEEGIDIPITDQHDRWYDSKVGVLHSRTVIAVFPVTPHVASQDIIVPQGANETWIVKDISDQGGIDYAMLDRAQSDFTPPPTAQGTVRMLVMGVTIG